MGTYGSKVWQRHRGYVPCRVYVNLCTRSIFSRTKVEGLDNLDNLPEGSAVLIASNHCCALMDPLSILLHLKTPAFGARSDIFANPKVAKILHWLRILPIARERNGREELARNLQTFKEIQECLGNGVPFGLYPEGMHRAERGMLPVKKGTFRVAREAAEALGKPVFIVPTGVDYEYFFREGGSMAVRFGKPVEISSYFASRAEMSDAEIYRELCAEMREKMLALIGKEEQRRHDLLPARVLLGLLLLPLYILCGIGALPIWAISELLLLRCSDKAWHHTVYFGVSLFLPLHWGFNWAFGILRNYYGKILNDI